MVNNLKTAMLLAGLGGLCVFIGSLWGPAGAVLGLLLGLVMCGGSYWYSDKLAIRSAGAVEVTAEQMPQYHAIVRDLASRADLPMPRLYVSPEAQPNAFATGRNPSHAAVCVTEGLLHTMDWTQIQGVLAHEMSHVWHRDILISSVAAAVAMGITFIASMARWAMIFGGGRSDDRDNPMAAFLMLMLAPLAAGLIQAAISRSREFEADAAAARLLGSGEPLAQALERLEVGSQTVRSRVNPAEASAYIVNPLRGQQLARMFSTHPPTAERIARLRGGDWV